MRGPAMFLAILPTTWLMPVGVPASAGNADSPCLVGFAETDLTPRVGGKAKPIFLAGFDHGRKATGVHDPIMARAVVLRHGDKKIAIVSADLVGLFQASVARVRAQLPGFSYVLVTCTHNHEGPDTLGLWGPNAFQSGVYPDYLKSVENKLAETVRAADRNPQPALARIGSAADASLLHDNREPYVKHDELVALRFLDAKGIRTLGLVVQWNCHPETLDKKNTLISADFTAFTVKHLQRKYQCPVVYLTGTVGGLMTSLRVEVKSAEGASLRDGTFEKTIRYGELVGDLAIKALAQARPLRLDPLEARGRDVFLPMDNELYHVGWTLGVLDRQGFTWTGDSTRADPLKPNGKKQRMCIQSEVAYLRLGDLEIACIPGEIYPELVLGKVQEPPDRGADFPDASIEPAIYKQLKGPHRMIVGLANDEIGYIIPKRQWDEKAPYCYGRKKAQYGEMNSLGPETAPLLCEAFRKLVKKQ